MNQNLRKHHLPAAMKVYYSPEDLAFHISLRRRLHRDIAKLSFQTFSCVLQQQIDSLLVYGSAKFKHAVTNAIKYKRVRQRQKIKKARVKTTKRLKKSMALRSKKKQQEATSFSLDIENFPPLLPSQNIAQVHELIKIFQHICAYTYQDPNYLLNVNFAIQLSFVAFR